MSQDIVEMPVFIDIDTDQQIDSLKSYFKTKNAKFSSNEDSLAALITNLDCLYNSDITETDLEMVLNSILSLIIIAPPEKVSKLVTTFCESILKAQLPEKFGVVKLIILSNLFHGLTVTSKDRYTVYINLARCSLNLKNLQYLPYKLDAVKKYLKLWNSKTEDVQALYRILFDALAQVNDSQNAFKTVIELLSTYTVDTASRSRDDAYKCIAYCINDPSIFIFDNLLSLEPIKYLEGELIHKLLTIFVSEKLQQYLEFASTYKSTITQLSLNHEKNIDKMRILTFVSLAEESKVIAFDVLQQQLQIKQEDIESFVIDAIRTKCIRCKIDHLGRTITIMSVSYRTFKKQHWQLLKEKLEKWKENLYLVDQNLTGILAQQQLQL